MTKEKLISFLIGEGYLKNQNIIRAFEKVDRADFVPDDQKEYAYENRPLPLFGGKAAISQPLVVAFMLELLDPRSGEKILEIGTGSGWQTALLSCLVCNLEFEEKSPEEKNVKKILSQNGVCGHVVSIERESDLKKFAEENLKKYCITDKGIVTLLCRNGLRGYKKESPYDKIISGAAPKEVPNEWKKMLKIGGRMVFPMGQSIFALEKTGKNSFSEKSYFGFSFQELIS